MLEAAQLFAERFKDETKYIWERWDIGLGANAVQLCREAESLSTASLVSPPASSP